MAIDGVNSLGLNNAVNTERYNKLKTQQAIAITTGVSSVGCVAAGSMVKNSYLGLALGIIGMLGSVTSFLKVGKYSKEIAEIKKQNSVDVTL